MTEPGDRSLTRRVFVNGRERRLRAGWRLIAATFILVLASLALFLAVDYAQAILSFAGPLVVGGILASTLVAQTASNVLVTGVFVVAAWFVDRRTLPDLGLGGRRWWRNLGFGLLLGVAMTTAVFAVELAAGLITVEQLFLSRPGLGIDQPFPVAFVLVVLMFVAVGVGEEVLFRGYLLTNIAEGLNGLGPIGPRTALGVAAVLTSAVFGVVHITNPNATLVSAFNITVVGLFLAWTYVVTEDLGIAIGVHITWNLSLSSVYGFPVSGLTTPATILDVRQTGDPLITGGPFGPEAGLVVYLALGVAIGLTWWWVRRGGASDWFPTGVAVPDLRKSPEPRTESE
ncbi:CPBP family intramembrane metalloprotease [Halobacteria archaeon HArc-gm2]|nr:CPBP family intramembrane metalloprotease [Halobacteria archaeon HArc-gm2]